MRMFGARQKFLLILLIGLLLLAAGSDAQDRFPRPEFETEYVYPLTTTPSPRAEAYAVIDIAALIVALSLAGYFALKTRSRRHLFILMVTSLVYFGFIRRGCVCSVGALQNITLTLSDLSYFVPISVIAFFILPLIFTLFFGRTFCASVCPLGAIQDVFVIKPVKVPAWLSHVLGMLPYLYLGFAVLFAATGSAFIICRYDPFVTLFRFSGRFGMVMLAAGFIILGMFVARPYCRFLCPYGVLLGWMSRLSRRHVKITPAECIECRLCEDSCPFDAIERPTPDKAPEPRKRGVRRLGMLIVLLPLLMLAGGWVFSSANGLFSRVHPDVRLAERIHLEDTGRVTDTILETRTFRSQGMPPEELFARVTNIRNQYKTGGWFLGIFLGLAFGMKLIGLSVRRTRTDYEPHRGNCLSCGRCFKYCPVEKSPGTLEGNP